MARRVDRESVVLKDGVSVDFTHMQASFWRLLTEVPVGDRVSVTDLCTKLEVEIRNLRVIKNKVQHLVGDVFKIRSRWGGFYYLEPVVSPSAEAAGVSGEASE